MLSWEWRCSWSSADRRCSKYIWVINNLIAYWSAPYIRDLTVYIFFQEHAVAIACKMRAILIGTVLLICYINCTSSSLPIICLLNPCVHFFVEQHMLLFAKNHDSMNMLQNDLLFLCYLSHFKYNTGMHILTWDFCDILLLFIVLTKGLFICIYTCMYSAVPL